MPAIAPDTVEPAVLAVLALVGAVASGINAFAGGGSLVSFPVLVWLGVPALPANATNSVALWPGSLASALGFREHWEASRAQFVVLLAPTILGSILGAWLLVSTPQRAFDLAVPALILLGTLLLAFQKRVRAWADARRDGPRSPTWAWIAQLGVAAYGGYFGAGMGILMLAAYGLFVEGSLHEHNAVKNGLAILINVAATALFFWKGLVWLAPALAMAVGAVVGGYLSARLSQRIAADRLRMAVVAYGLAMFVWFVWRAAFA